MNCLGLQKESGGLREPLIILKSPSPLGSPRTYQPIHLSAEEIKKCREACTTQKKSVVQMQPRVNPTQKEKIPGEYSVEFPLDDEDATMAIKHLPMEEERQLALYVH